MKKVKMILSIIALALVTFVLVGLYNSKPLTDIHITKKVTISGDEKEIFDMVRYLNNFPKWSPFLVEDPSQKYEVKGTDGQVGAQYHWNGNGGTDLGFQEIAKIEENKYIKMSCDIQKPFVARPTFEYSFTPTENGVTVTQDFKLKSGTVDAFFMWLFDAKKGMADTNEKGLSLLKTAVERLAVAE